MARCSGAEVHEPLTGDVVVLATPYDGALDFVDSRADELAGKVVVDITNPWTGPPSRGW